MRASSLVVPLCLVFGILANVHPASGQSAPQGSTVSGHWYMGTMSGEDHNLTLNADGTLSLQNGGCFHQEPSIKSSWRQQGSQITFDNAVLKRQLGTYLRIIRYQGYLLLVPQRQEAEIAKSSGYPPYYCFWQNLMQDGLQLPQLAYRDAKRNAGQHARQFEAGLRQIEKTKSRLPKD